MYPFSNSWKYKKTVRFCNVLREQRKGALGTNGLISDILSLTSLNLSLIKLILIKLINFTINWNSQIFTIMESIKTKENFFSFPF